MSLDAQALPSFVEQANWAELLRWGGLSDQKIKKGTFVRVEKLSFWQSPLKICDLAGTPNTLILQIRVAHNCIIAKKSSKRDSENLFDKNYQPQKKKKLFPWTFCFKMWNLDNCLFSWTRIQHWLVSAIPIEGWDYKNMPRMPPAYTYHILSGIKKTLRAWNDSNGKKM